ncbi:M48 family metallopeptidase [Rubellimicrobium sp. CFH 75288]|uniref:M48 family metallopeptidase n=1 Tax=Rubellimicrobium sp. CFH 75288 TaxID=2697034 RepID=UPI0014125516|nr:M48 family metallopeptidase [Rubellimicrobium sp. CFH 75288]NAZ35260.1 M48 family metalloprotease [Rubellimicrobium sp. CFH 75288]
MRLFRLAASLAVCVALGACVAPPPRGPVGAPVPDRIMVPAAPADRGLDRARTFLSVAERIEPVAEVECRRRNPPSVNCDFRIVVDDRPGMPPNAFQTIGRDGRPLLAFTLALLAEVENEDELAFVMAHEAAHHIAGHLARQDVNASRGAAIFGELASQRAGATAESIRRAQLLGAQVGARTFSKEFELEADAIGTVVAARAGFDPIRGAQFFLRIPDPGNRFLGTHPPNAERIATVRRAAAEIGFRPR